jgi:hypothetical protein
MKHYSVMDHSFILMYMEQYPETMHRVAVELGYHDPPLGVELNSAPSENEWFDGLIQQYHLADLPGGKHTPPANARVWLKTVMRTVPTIDKLVELVQYRLSEEREAHAV